MTEAVKHDHGKPRYDLIPPVPLDELARVYTEGAKKYTSVTNCTAEGAIKWLEDYAIQLSRHLVIQIKRFTQENYVEIVMKNGSRPTIQVTQRDKEKTVEDGLLKTATRDLQRKSEEGQTLPSEPEIKKQSLLECFATDTALPLMNLTPLKNGKEESVQFVAQVFQPPRKYMSITVIKRDGREELYVVGATSISECLRKTLNFCIEHCNISNRLPRPSFSEKDEGEISIELSGARNWEKGMEWGRIFAAAQRHMWAWQAGEDFDPETELHHLAHAAWGCFTLIAYQERGSGEDDREGAEW